LLVLLEQEEFSVAELAAITQLAQPRVSTHLGKLREAHLVSDRRDGVSVYYRMPSVFAEHSVQALWQTIKEHTRDPLLRQDHDRIAQVLAARARDHSWADSVAGDMERHYSPGRTWEATARGLVQLLDLGEVLDIASGDGVLAELLAPRVRRLVCLDLSGKVIEAGQKRLAAQANVEFQHGDMHDLPFTAESFDTVLLLHALTYTENPQKVLSEAARVLRPKGQLLAITLRQHGHEKAVEPFDHVNLGFTVRKLSTMCTKAGLSVSQCAVSAVEKRAPNFAVLTLLAEK
jgi:ArsR family transcriptional regulator